MPCTWLGFPSIQSLSQKRHYKDWVAKAYWYMMAEYTVAQVAAESVGLNFFKILWS